MSCPICQRETDPKFRPFCSRRCADVDLGKWISGAYAIAARDREDGEEALDASENHGEEPGKLH